MNVTFEELKQLVRDIDDLADETSDWEAEFIESMLGRDYYTDKQINKIRQLHKKYCQ